MWQEPTGHSTLYQVLEQRSRAQGRELTRNMWKYLSEHCRVQLHAMLDCTGESGQTLYISPSYQSSEEAVVHGPPTVAGLAEVHKEFQCGQPRGTTGLPVGFQGERPS